MNNPPTNAERAKILAEHVDALIGTEPGENLERIAMHILWTNPHAMTIDVADEVMQRRFKKDRAARKARKL